MLLVRRRLVSACLRRSISRYSHPPPTLNPHLLGGGGVGWSSVLSRRQPQLQSRLPSDFLLCRSFAAPVQAVPKPKPEQSKGPRVNEAIKAPRVRLVTDKGHSVVLLAEALEQARRLDLDLVEVQQTADPPVCKILDFHKEKYKKEAKGKELAKTKASNLRTGVVKEVRFKAKTEEKDLQVKADGVIRLMEKGYRVKCSVLPTGNAEDPNRATFLGEQLSRMLALLEDVSVVETGPHVETRLAYFIVRHAKFSSPKIGKKARDPLTTKSAVTKAPAIVSTGKADMEFDATPEESEPDGADSGYESSTPFANNQEHQMQVKSETFARQGQSKTMINGLSNAVRRQPTDFGHCVGSLKNDFGLEKKEEPRTPEVNRYATQKEHMGRFQRHPQSPPLRHHWDNDNHQNSVRGMDENGRQGYDVQDRDKNRRHGYNVQGRDENRRQQPPQQSYGVPENEPTTNAANSSSPRKSYGIFTSALEGATSERNFTEITQPGQANNQKFAKSCGIFTSSKASLLGTGMPDNKSQDVPKYGPFSAPRPTAASDNRR